MTLLLTIDTSTRNASLALYDPQRGVVARDFWTGEQDHTTVLAERVQKLLGGNLEDMARQLSGIVIALGPGSFTGTRAGLSLAKGLALADSLPLVGIPTPDALAHSQKPNPFPLYAILEAGRGRISVAQYLADGERWQRNGDYRITTLADLARGVSGPAIFCGEIENTSIVWRQRNAGALIFPEVFRWPYLSQLGWERLERGEADDLHRLEPIYLSPAGE